MNIDYLFFYYALIYYIRLFIRCEIIDIYMLLYMNIFFCIYNIYNIT